MTRHNRNRLYGGRSINMFQEAVELGQSADTVKNNLSIHVNVRNNVKLHVPFAAVAKLLSASTHRE
jgi:hypothetical protein